MLEVFVRGSLACLAAASAALSTVAADAPPAIELSGAWAPAAGEAGADVPLYLTITNRAGEPDDLLRVRCPVAQFSEKLTTDYGEGTPAGREVKSILVPANGNLELAPGRYFLRLLQTTRPLRRGETFPCTLTFKNGGRREVLVMVMAEDAKPAP
jgi:copper(I)-binding protein